MNTMQITNLILRKAYEKDITVETHFSVFNNGMDPAQPMIQLNLKTKYFKDFAFYYALYDRYFNYSATFIVDDNKDIKAKRLFNLDKGIFNEYSTNDDYSIIELVNEIDVESINEEDIDNIFEYITSEHELINHLNDINNGKEFVLECDETTDLLLKKLYKSGLDVELELDIDDSADDAVQVQINVKPKYFRDFAIFYGTKDNKLNFSSIFEVDNKNDFKAKELFDKDNGIFKSFIVDEDDEKIHLYTEISFKDLNDKFIDEIIKYLSEEHELINYLNRI